MCRGCGGLGWVPRRGEVVVRVFVINLARSVARRQTMAEQLRQLGLPYEIWAAIDGRLLDEAEYLQQGGASGLFPGEVGCYQSHLTLWRKIRDEQIPCAFILEDDARIDPDTLQVLNALETRVADFDVARLSAIEKQVGTVLQRVNDTRQLVVPTKNPSGLAGYVLTNEGAKRLVNLAEPPCIPVDTLVDRSWVKGVRMVMVSPAPVRHAEGVESTITDVKRRGLRSYDSGFCERVNRSVRKRLFVRSMVRGWAR